MNNNDDNNDNLDHVCALHSFDIRVGQVGVLRRASRTSGERREVSTAVSATNQIHYEHHWLLMETVTNVRRYEALFKLLLVRYHNQRNIKYIY